METLYDQLQKLQPTTTERPPTPLKHLLHLPSTADAEATLQIRLTILEQSSLPTNRGFIDGNALRRAKDRVSWAQEQIEMCKERDAIQATRPEGCWCLGLGGEDERTTGEDTYWDKTCTCPDGLIAAEHRRTVRKAVADQRERARIETVWDNAQIPARFKGMRLSTSPLAKTHPAIISRLQPLAWPTSEEGSSEWDVFLPVNALWWGSWFIYGGYGTGKTGLAVSMAWDRVVIGVNTGGQDDCPLEHVLFVAGPRLFSELRSTYNRDSGETEQEVIDRYAKADLLILDDIGAEQVKNQDWIADRLYQIVGERHDELRPTIFTSNLTLEQLAKRVGERVTWRIVEMVGQNIVHIEGPNLRA